MKRLLLCVAVTAGALALMFGEADAVLLVTFHDESEAPLSVGLPILTGTGITPRFAFDPPPAESVTVFLDGAFLAATAPEVETLGLTEPGSDEISDIIRVSKTSTGLAIAFVSDSGTSLGLCSQSPGFSCLPETAHNPVLPSIPIFNAQGIPIAGGPLAISAFSDVETVPEPTTLLLLGSSLVGFGALSHKRTRAREHLRRQNDGASER